MLRAALNEACHLRMPYVDEPSRGCGTLMNTGSGVRFFRNAISGARSRHEPRMTTVVDLDSEQVLVAEMAGIIRVRAIATPAIISPLESPSSRKVKCR